MSDIKPWIYLPLDEAFGPTLRDASGNRRNAAGKGGFEIVPDATFGACVALRQGTVTLPTLEPQDFPNGLTLLVWFKVANLDYRVLIDVVHTYTPTDTSTSFCILANAGMLVYGIQDPHRGWVTHTRQDDPLATPNEWHLLVASLTASDQLVGGSPDNYLFWGTPGLGTETPCPAIVKLSHIAERGETPLQMARFRLYDRVLNDAQIDAIRRSDIDQLPHPPAVSESRLPIDFALQNGNGASALLLETEGQGQSMTLRVAPTGEACQLSALHGDVSATNWHFRLAFRPGTLKRLDQIRVIGSEWKLFAAHESGQDALYLLAENAPTLPLRIDLTGFYVDERQGPRTTRIQLAYQQVERVGNGIRTGRVQIECG